MGAVPPVPSPLYSSPLPIEFVPMPAGRKFQTPALKVTPELLPVLVTVRVPVVGVVAQVGLELDPLHPWVDSVTCITSVPPLILHGAVPPRVQPEGLVIGGP